MSDYYTTTRIIATCRRLMNDEIEPYFVSDADLVDFMNRRLRELGVTAMCLTTSEEFTVEAKADDPWLDAPEAIIKPRSLYDAANDRTVVFIPFSEINSPTCYMDYGLHFGVRWREHTGPPDGAVADIEDGKWRLVPIPTENTSYTVDGFRYPGPIASVNEDFDVRDDLLEDLHLGVLASAFAIEDADAIYDPQKQRDYENKWIAAMRDRTLRHTRDRRASGRAIRYGGY